MSKVERKLSRLARIGNGRSAHLLENELGGVSLAFRAPIKPEHVENGRFRQYELFSRDGNKRLATVHLDEESAKAAYRLLHAWHKERVQRDFILSFLARVVMAMHQKPFLARLMR